MSRLTRSKCPGFDYWVSVRFLDDGKWFACTLQRVLNCVQEPDIYNVVWTDGLKYKAQILKRGTKQYVHATEDDTSVKSAVNQMSPSLPLSISKPGSKEDGVKQHMHVTEDDTSVKSAENQMCPSLPLSILKPETQEDVVKQHMHVTEDDTSVKSTENQMSPSLLLSVLKPVTEEDVGEKGATHDQSRDEETFSDDNDRDYIPDTEEESSCNSNVNSICAFTPIKFPNPTKIRRSDIKNTNSQMNLHINLDQDELSKDSTTSEIFPFQNLNPQNFVQEEGYTVRKCRKKENGKRSWDKIHYCIYCFKPFKQLPKHLRRKHINEQDIQKVLALDKVIEDKNQGQQAKVKAASDIKIIFLKLRNHGDFVHNSKVHKAGMGEIITCKSKSQSVDPQEYLACRYCKGAIMRQHMFRHMKTCKLKPDVHNAKPYSRVQNSCVQLFPAASSATSGLIANIMDNMLNDDVAIAARRDNLIMSYGSRLYSKVAHDPNKYGNVSCKIREVSRLLISLQELHPGKTLSEFISPAHFTDCVTATRNLTEWDEEIGEFGNPSLALKLGYHLKKLSCRKEGLAIEECNEEMERQATQFLKLRESNWSECISSHALRTLSKRKWNKPEILPVVDDLMKLLDYLKKEGSKYSNLLQEDSTNRHAWFELNQITLTRIILFNRRRSGEAARIKLDNYLDRNTHQMHSDILNSLSDFEKALCEKLTRFEVEGKFGRKVPVILSRDVKENLDLLIMTRNAVGVSPENPHLCARPFFNSKSSIRGHDCLRKHAVECGAAHPQYITSTRLRKHIATVSQVFDLTESELDILCGYMGHDIRVHRNFYRLPEGTLQVAKLSRILITMERGEMHLYKGKSLEEIQFNPEDILDEEKEVEETIGEDKEDSPAETIEPASVAKPKPRKKPTQDTGSIKVKKTKGTKWTTVEEAAVSRQLGGFLRDLQVPGS